jgi:hypothetical protein
VELCGLGGSPGRAVSYCTLRLYILLRRKGKRQHSCWQVSPDHIRLSLDSFAHTTTLTPFSPYRHLPTLPKPATNGPHLTSGEMHPLNLKVLQRHDPSIESIIESATYVVLYHYEGIEGSMFIYKRSVRPSLQLKRTREMQELFASPGLVRPVIFGSALRVALEIFMGSS